MLEVEGISVFYGDIQVLWDVSLKVAEGEIVTLVGSNGAGKTTLVETLSGILRPRSGRIRFLDKEIDRLPPHEIVELGIVQIPEGRQLFPQMTVLENLEMGTYPARARGQKEEGLNWVYQLFPVLAERRDQLAGTLSGGEQQMLAIARGLMSRPRFLILDEPSLGLAPLLVMELFRVVKEINSAGVTILLIEQNVRRALEIAHRAYVMGTGRITIEGKAEELLHNDYVRASYLGI